VRGGRTKGKHVGGEYGRNIMDSCEIGNYSKNEGGEERRMM
jgi:hypothetical protein